MSGALSDQIGPCQTREELGAMSAYFSENIEPMQVSDERA